MSVDLTCSRTCTCTTWRRMVLYRTAFVFPVVSSLLLIGCVQSVPCFARLELSDLTTGERITEIFLDFATIDTLGDSTPDEILDSIGKRYPVVSESSGTPRQAGRATVDVNVRVLSSVDISSGQVDRFWLVRFERNGGPIETIVIESPLVNPDFSDFVGLTGGTCLPRTPESDGVRENG